MSTTRTTTGTTKITTTIKKITFTEDQLDPYVTHAPTRRWLTGPGLPGLPGDGGLLTFEALRTDGLRTVADSTGDPEGRLAAELRDRLVIGGILGADGRSRESVLLDGMTGEISTTYFLHDRPDLMDTRPLAPSLEKLVRCATAVDELTALRGQFASYAGRLGPQAVTEATRHLLAVFEDSAAGEAAKGADGASAGLFWKLAAVIRPLALVAGPGTRSGLALDLPVRLLDEEFGSGEIVRFEDVDFPKALTHAPTRDFLREVGLPEEAVWFTLETDMPLQTLAEYGTDDRADDRAGDPSGEHRLPAAAADADRLIRLGHLLEDTSLVVDGTTGAVLTWSEPDQALRPLNADISTLAFTLWLIRRERALDAVHELTDAYGQLADTMSRTLAAVDPLACAPTPDGLPYWPTVFEDETGGGLCAEYAEYAGRRP
ncbi:SUKH-4 immunity protein [Streptomyces sp. yr375]|uniref:SUKH-4 family immunity protein n=1 Tax=Streptomyces sp. yr375 TaxID=1761906 RepID=UPI0008ADAC96|nr:SUKH-4 family immunity protein [Streptomyces sp. yr375]SEQ28743.1 SUKH-4 immunity protein [Streptomyces sp. yr375]